MGEVYLGEQDERRRRAALKIIKLGMETDRVIARFEVKRQVLAMMIHPNVAKVFDAGSTQPGRPFFVMEYLDRSRILAIVTNPIPQSGQWTQADNKEDLGANSAIDERSS